MVHIAESKTGPWSTIGMPAIRFASRSAYISWIHTAITLLYSIHAMGIHTGQINVSTEVCVVIRAYWGHGRASQQGLYQLITSMQRQSNPKWEAVVMVLDSQPFSDLPHILQDLDDDRVWVFAEWIGPEFAARVGPQWVPTYHSMLYNLTDEAVRACPRTARWVIITNGDNEYSSTLFDELEQHREADVVALNYYSRYQRPTAKPCERFAAEPGKPAGKQNLLRWCHTDLGANILSWPRLMQEDKRFSQLGPIACGLAAEHFDGVLAHHLVDSEWAVHHVTEQCLYDHNPSPQRCARIGGVWDDSNNVWDGGGSCISQKEATEKMLDDTSGLEEISIVLSSDGNLSSFDSVDPAPTNIRCLRQKDVAAQHAQMMDYFGSTCTPDTDIEYVKGLMGDRWHPSDWSCIGTAQQVLEQQKQEQLHQQHMMRVPPPPDLNDKTRKPTFRRRYDPSAESALRDEL